MGEKDHRTTTNHKSSPVQRKEGGTFKVIEKEGYLKTLRNQKKSAGRKKAGRKRKSSV